MASRYGPKAKQKVARAMRKRKRGTLKSGSGRKVKSRKQAIAIGLSEARRAGGKVPSRKKKSSSKRKSGSKSKSGSGRKSSSGRKSGSGKKSSSGSKSSSGRKKAKS